MNLEFSVVQLEIRSGGANNSLLLITHPDCPQHTILTRDREILSALAAIGDRAISQQLFHLVTQRRASLQRTVSWVVVCLLGILGLFLLRAPATRLLADFIPRSWEGILGRAAYTALSTSSDIVDDEKLVDELEGVLRPILNVVAKSGYSFRFHISRDTHTNAFALPGGILIINAGTILKSSRPEELLGVVAHELAHVTKRHATRQIISVLGLYAVADILFGGTVGMIAAGSQGAVYLLQQGFSRDQEQEADEEGLKHLSEARIDPRGLVEFFSKVQEEQEKMPLVGEIGRYVDFLSSHPATDDRIEYLTNQINSLPSGGFDQLERSSFERFQQRVRSAIGLGGSGLGEQQR